MFWISEYFQNYADPDAFLQAEFTPYILFLHEAMLPNAVTFGLCTQPIHSLRPNCYWLATTMIGNDWLGVYSSAPCGCAQNAGICTALRLCVSMETPKPYNSIHRVTQSQCYAMTMWLKGCADKAMQYMIM